jgi:hypothetical protein
MSIDELFQTQTTRARARALLARARAGTGVDGLRHFAVHDEALPSVAALVARTTRARYPDLNIPYHSRWRHFEAGGVDRRAWLGDKAKDPKTLIDLVVVSVLLDAGAGPSWSYREERTGQVHARSEGLGVASFHAFTSGLFSSDPSEPLRADSAGLQRLTTVQLAQAFQVSDTNPLVGLEGRVNLLRRLGRVMGEHADVYGALGRPGALFEAVLSQNSGQKWQFARMESAQDAIKSVVSKPSIKAHDLLSLLLSTLSRMWPSGSSFGDTALGDCWPHPALGSPDSPAGWMPFHKLSQWLTYSLLEPFEWAGVTVDGLDELTGLPEYRNGGLLLDGGVLSLKDAAQAERHHKPSDEFIIEWRALTVALLDELAPLVCAQLGKDMPLACILEGGTWAAGRVLAQDLRAGKPPLQIDSDGTIF